MPLNDDPKKITVGETIFDYNLRCHGFCVLKVVEKINSSALNQALLIGEGRRKGVKFNSLGQEEEGSYNFSGERGMLDVGKALNSESVLDSVVKTYLKDFLNVARGKSCEFLKREFGSDYDEKGRTLLRSVGTLGNQKLHVDARLDCTCNGK